MNQNIKLEQSVVGSSLFDANAIAKIAPILKPPDLANPKNQKILAAQISMFERGVAIDMLTLAEELRRNGDDIDDAYLVEVSARADATNVEHHAKILKELSIKRQTVTLGLVLQSEGKNPEKDAFETLQLAENSILEMSGVLSIKNPRLMSKIVTTQRLELDEVRDGKRLAFGQKTGFYDLDNIIGGLQEPDLVTVAGLTSVGKTAFALKIAKNVAKSEHVGFFSMEMSEKQLFGRLASMESDFPYDVVMGGKWSAFQESKIIPAFLNLANLKMVIDEQSALTVLDVKSKTKKLIADYGVKGIVIDYLGHMNHGENESLNNAIGETMKGLKAIAKDYRIWVMLLCQLNRGAATDGIKRPQLHNLRDSGNVEQDSDIVIFVHRPEKFMKESTIDKDGKNWAGIAEIIVEKNRPTGRTGWFDVKFVRECARFENLSPKQEIKEIGDVGELLYKTDGMPF